MKNYGYTYLTANGFSSFHIAGSGVKYVPDANGVIAVKVPDNGRDIQDLVACGCSLVNRADLLPEYRDRTT